jgi:hypothetical protein
VGARLTQALITAEINRYYGCALGLNETLDMDEAFVDELIEVARALTSGAK